MPTPPNFGLAEAAAMLAREKAANDGVAQFAQNMISSSDPGFQAARYGLLGAGLGAGAGLLTSQPGNRMRRMLTGGLIGGGIGAAGGAVTGGGSTAYNAITDPESTRPQRDAAAQGKQDVQDIRDNKRPADRNPPPAPVPALAAPAAAKPAAPVPPAQPSMPIADTLRTVGDAGKATYDAAAPAAKWMGQYSLPDTVSAVNRGGVVEAADFIAPTAARYATSGAAGYGAANVVQDQVLKAKARATAGGDYNKYLQTRKLQSTSRGKNFLGALLGVTAAELASRKSVTLQPPPPPGAK